MRPILVRLCNIITLFSLTVSSVGAQTITYIHTDALGSPVAVTDTRGVVIEEEFYDPFGSALIGGAGDRPGYAGHVADSATGLSYMDQRYYDPQLGRFLSVDPVSALGDPVSSFNRYRYANNNPYRFTDVDGRQSRELNWESRRLGIEPPPRAEGDWLGPAIGVGLTTILAAPVVGFVGSAAYANPATANAVMTGVADIAMGETLGGASVGGATVLAITAKEITAINRSVGGTHELTGTVDTVIANMSYREGVFDQAATAIRDIAGRHLFNDGNKRTAQKVAEKMLGKRASSSTIRSTVDDVGKGDLRNVDDISTRLQGRSY